MRRTLSFVCAICLSLTILLNNCCAEDFAFSFRNDIRFDDSMETVRSKEPSASRVAENRLWVTRVALSGIDDSIISYEFEYDKIPAQYPPWLPGCFHIARSNQPKDRERATEPSVRREALPYMSPTSATNQKARHRIRQRAQGCLLLRELHAVIVVKLEHAVLVGVGDGGLDVAVSCLEVADNHGLVDVDLVGARGILPIHGERD